MESEILELLRRHGCDLRGVLEPGEELVVVGRARWADDPEGEFEVSAGYREQRSVTWDHDDHLRATDDLLAFGGAND